MHTTTLRKIGGSIMLTLPKTMLSLLHLKEGARVNIAINNGCLTIEPNPSHKYTLSDILAASDYTQIQPESEREWIDAPSVGKEI